MKKLLFLVLALLVASQAHAQSPVITQPYNVNSGNSSSTISSTNTFQQIWAAITSTRGRAGCTIQNNGTHTMYVYFGTTPITPSSVQLTAGQSVNCTIGGITLQDQVSITGTSGDAFFANQQ